MAVSNEGRDGGEVVWLENRGEPEKRSTSFRACPVWELRNFGFSVSEHVPHFEIKNGGVDEPARHHHHRRLRTELEHRGSFIEE